MSGAPHRALRNAPGGDSKPWLAVGVLVLMVILRIVDPATLARLRLASFDLLESAWPAATENRVVIVDVDEPSLSWVGQWPWARSTLAQLTSAIAAMQPAVIGFDVPFPAPDRLSPQELVRYLPSVDAATRARIMSLPSNDALLAASFRRVPVVLSMTALPPTALIGNPGVKAPGLPVAEVGAGVRTALTPYANLIANIAVLSDAAAGWGAGTLAADEDGVLRRGAAAIVVHNRIFPGLAVEMARVAAGADGITLVAGAFGIDGVRIAGNRLATDDAGNLWIHYARAHSLPVLSAVDILAGRISAGSIRGKLVLVGATAGRISDDHATPLGDRRPGVEIHAQLLQNIVTGDVLARPGYMTGCEVLLLLIAGGVFILGGRRLRGWRLLPLFLALLAALFAIAVLACTQARLLVDSTAPALLVILLYMSAITQGILAEERARRRTEDQLRQALLRAETASKAKTDFLANMSHELRTPLTAILGFSDSIRQQLFGPIAPAKYGDYVNEIHASGSHLLAIVSDVLDLSRIEAGEARLDEDALELGPAIEACARMLRLRVEKKHLDLRIEFDPALPRLRADRRMLKQMLLNLLANAVTYTPEGGRVMAKAFVDPAGRIAIAVRDNGIGIAKDDLEHVMEPFHIVEAPQARNYQGIGLGLPLTKTLVRLHGGELKLESEIGIGTTATLTFPAARTMDPKSDRKIPPPRSEGG